MLRAVVRAATVCGMEDLAGIAIVTLLVCGESETREVSVPWLGQDKSADLAISKVTADWSFDDRMNTEIELVGVRLVGREA